MAKISVLGSGSWGLAWHSCCIIMAMKSFFGRQDRRMPGNSGKKEKILTGFRGCGFRMKSMS